MLYAMTSQDVKTGYSPFQDVFRSSSREEISVSEILKRWFLSFRGKSFEKPFFAIPNLSQILQIDYSSLIYRPIQFKSETALTEEFYKKAEQSEVLQNISRICDKLISEEEVFKEIDKSKLLKEISEMLEEIPLQQMKISECELSERIRKILVVETVFGVVKDLNPQQIKAFDEAVKRRPLFK